MFFKCRAESAKWTAQFNRVYRGALQGLPNKQIISFGQTRFSWEPFAPAALGNAPTGEARGGQGMDLGWIWLLTWQFFRTKKTPNFQQPQFFYQNRSTLICTICFPGAILHQAPGTKFLKRSGPFDESCTTSVRAFQIFLAVSQSIT